MATRQKGTKEEEKRNDWKKTRVLSEHKKISLPTNVRNLSLITIEFNY
jgi:hypothetical protein